MRTNFPDWLAPIVIITALAVLTACGGGGGEAGAGAGQDETTEAAEPATSASCVAEYAQSPCDLLTAELVRGQVEGAPADMEQDSYTSSMFSSCSYSWESGRMRTQDVAGMTMDISEPNNIGLSWIDTYETDDPASQFRREYLPTAEEFQRGREMLQDELDEQVEEGELAEEGREMAGGIEESVAGDMSFQSVDGVGDRASWDGNTLYVLHGATKFQVEATVSADSSENRAAAVAVANALIAACQ